MGLDLKYAHGQTPLDEDEKDGLKIYSINTQGELDEFEQLNIEKALEWTIRTNFKPERIVSIHCFPNGNGRHSRLMADIIMESIFNKEAFGWHQSNMVNSNNGRKEYIRALRQADRGDIRPLIEFATS